MPFRPTGTWPWYVCGGQLLRPLFIRQDAGRESQSSQNGVQAQVSTNPAPVLPCPLLFCHDYVQCMFCFQLIGRIIPCECFRSIFVSDHLLSSSIWVLKTLSSSCLGFETSLVRSYETAALKESTPPGITSRDHIPDKLLWRTTIYLSRHQTPYLPVEWMLWPSKCGRTLWLLTFNRMQIISTLHARCRIQYLVGQVYRPIPWVTWWRRPWQEVTRWEVKWCSSYFISSTIYSQNWRIAEQKKCSGGKVHNSCSYSCPLHRTWRCHQWVHLLGVDLLISPKILRDWDKGGQLYEVFRACFKKGTPYQTFYK